jgi:hypothetical protein
MKYVHCHSPKKVLFTAEFAENAEGFLVFLDEIGEGGDE